MMGREENGGEGFAHSVEYNVHSSTGTRSVKIVNIIFEVNRVTVRGVSVFRENRPGCTKEVPMYKFTAALDYTTGPDVGMYGSRHQLSAEGETSKDALGRVYAKLKTIRHCDTCTTVYDSTIADHCVVCLFSDYFTKENPNVLCVVCTKRTRDFTTIGCGHRFCYGCLAKNQKKTCPLCRSPYRL
jgi:hypothetical protein